MAKDKKSILYLVVGNYFTANQIKQGLPYYIAFVKKFPTVFDLAKANETAVLNLWQGLGYYSRARNLHITAKHIANELNGDISKQL